MFLLGRRTLEGFFMKRLALITLALVAVFFSAWRYRVSTPVNRPSNLASGQQTAWYEGNYTAPTADDEWKIDETIPDNYIPVPGQDELYMIVDDTGKIIGYRHRTKQSDGSWVWEDVNPDIPDNYESTGIKDVYKVTGADGTVKYVKYVRNDDDTFCFVDCKEDGTPLDVGTDATSIDTKHYIKEDGNVYAKYNDNGVLEGYRERVDNGNGTYTWKLADPPKSSIHTTNGSTFTTPDTSGAGQSSGGTGDSGVYYSDKSSPEVTQNSDGTRTETTTTLSTKTQNGYRITYQTLILNTYDVQGNLIRTSQQGPTEIKREKVSGNGSKVNKDAIASTLDAELTRVSGSVSFDTDTANQLLSQMNASRAASGLPALQMSSSSDAYKLACIRAADMAIYDHSSTSSPMYGTLDDMVSRWGVSCSLAYENILKTYGRDAKAINARFESDSASSENMLSSSVKSVGIAVVNANSQEYIAEVFLE